MRYAEVCVNSPIAGRRTFSYSIPAGFAVEAGQAVWVPFGARQLQGIIMELVPQPQVEETRELAGVIEPRLVISTARIQLARWISDYYLSPLFDAVALMLPPGFSRKTLPALRLSGIDMPEYEVLPDETVLLDLLSSDKSTDIRYIEKQIGVLKSRRLINGLLKLGLVERLYRIEPEKVKPRYVQYIEPAMPEEELERILDELPGNAVKQRELLQFFKDSYRTVAIHELREHVTATAQTLKTLENRGILHIRQVEVIRDPVAGIGVQQSFPLPLTADQKNALEQVRLAIQDSSPQNRAFFLHGVTGSGKTEVYLQALAETVRLGKQGIVLVPEIALTPQTIERFTARFPGRVAVLHSRLTIGEQFDEWRRIANGEFAVVIGSRSALFAPQPDLGLIVIDEEHEWTYKQNEGSPRYHAGKTALKLSELTGATLVRGSATPDVETYYNARNSRYTLLELPERINAGNGSGIPPVEIIDMRDELKHGNRSIFSRSLADAIGESLARKEQVVLFLNRRGSSTFIQCRSCGYVLRCRRCDLPLSYHREEDSLVCHQCNIRRRNTPVCPQCSSRKIKYLGTGTQKLEQETAAHFPAARILRWDSDSIRAEHMADEKILKSFRAHESDILIGTQMIAKGLDFPLVTLVGVVNADTSLYLPDFRAGERTFQILHQVAGRAGRGAAGGRVIVQTYSPEHYAIQAAEENSYRAFYEKEIGLRRQLNEPPFSELARLVYTQSSDRRCEEESRRMANVLMKRRDEQGISGLSVIGPAPAYHHRIRNRYRWQIILRGTELSSFLSGLDLPRGWTVDIDPVTVL